jgi:AP2-associated kinase
VNAAASVNGLTMPQIYASRTQSEARRYQELPPSPVEAPMVGAVFSPPVQETQIIPDIAPMRRGRPGRPTSQHNSTKPSPSPFRGLSDDPFAALDGGKPKVETTADELSFRFPTLDQFSLLHETGGKFDFEPTVLEIKPEKKPELDDLSRRVAQALADDAFVKPSPANKTSSQEPTENRRPESSPPEKKQKDSPNPARESAGSQTPLHQSIPQKPKMVSTGTMTSPPPPPPPSQSETKPFSNPPIFRFPPSGYEDRPSSQQRPAGSEGLPAGPGSVPSQTTLIHKVEPKSWSSVEKASDFPVSSRPSLETSRPSLLDINESLTRSKSANSKSRPSSLYSRSKVDFVRDQGNRYTTLDQPRIQYEDGVASQHTRNDNDDSYERGNITSDVEFLRAREGEGLIRKRDKRLSAGSKHIKRSSLSSLSLSGTKGLLCGRFGEAFRRFEQNAQGSRSRSLSPNDANKRLTRITGSEVTDMSDHDISDHDQHDVSPEMRRELERRRLSQEEKRVANAAAEYRQRLAEGGTGGRIGGREGVAAPAIQNKVQCLLVENYRLPLKTASGYGRFTDSNAASQARQFESSPEKEYSLPLHPRPKPPRDHKEPSGVPSSSHKDLTASNTGPASHRPGERPAAPPKPKNLRTGGMPDASATISGQNSVPSLQGMPASPSEDWEANFGRRYPSLSGLELVETEIGIAKASSIKTREV